MTQQTKIEWVKGPNGESGRTWNPIVGCSLASPGCTNCYAMRMAYRLSKNPSTPQYHGTAKMVNGKPVFTGKLELVEKALLEPLKRKKPTDYFVNSMSDLFHEDMPDDWIDRVFAVMALCPQHTFKILSKRADRMRDYLTRPAGNGKQDVRNHLAWDVVLTIMNRWAPGWKNEGIDGKHRSRAIQSFTTWPLPNVWLGVSVEDQRRADERVPLLLQTPAAIRFISAEPLLGPVDLTKIDMGTAPATSLEHQGIDKVNFKINGLAGVQSFGWPALDQVIVGGESGPNARPMHPDWARSLRDQCKAAGTAFFFKQWGEWLPGDCNRGQFDEKPLHAYRRCDNHSYDWPSISRRGQQWDNNDIQAFRVGKKAAGRLLDGREWNEFPTAQTGGEG